MKTAVLVKDVQEYVLMLKSSALESDGERDIVPDYNCGVVSACNSILFYLQGLEFRISNDYLSDIDYHTATGKRG